MRKRFFWIRLTFIALGVIAALVTGYLQNIGQRRSLANERASAMMDLSKPAKSKNRRSYDDGASLLCEAPYKTICQRAGVTQDPTGIVRKDVSGEVRALRLYEQIIHANPDWTSEQVDEELVKKIYTPKQTQRVRLAEQWVKSTLIRWLDNQSEKILTADEKKRLTERLKSAQLELPPPASVYADERDLFTKNDVYFERLDSGKLRLRVGGAYLFTARSFFNTVFTIAHELGHVIDPCEMRIGGAVPKFYESIVSCFFEQGWVENKPTRIECQAHDQVSEAFADWIAVQITSLALQVFTVDYDQGALVQALINSVRDLCEQDENSKELNLEFHPSPEVRIRKIFFPHPRIRKIAGCRRTVFKEKYCGMEMVIRK